MVTVWSPKSVLQRGSYVLCVLNQSVQSPSSLISAWNNAQYRCTVDGGTSVWTQIVNNTRDTVVRDVPDLITGDFDSADMTHVEHFKLLGSKVVATPDQDYTDFTKCLQQLSSEMKSGHNKKLDNVEAVFAFVESSGRLDQIMANIQTLFLAQDLLHSRPVTSDVSAPVPVFQLSSSTLSWLLAPGHHKIVTRECVSARSHCGLIPLDGRAVVSSSGLKWNLDQGVLRFGELVSTSNGFNMSDDHVSIETDNYLLWTMDFD